MPKRLVPARRVIRRTVPDGMADTPMRTYDLHTH